ncbi:MAG: hypothetical protein QM820_41745 [Minicystis sp.]
MMLRKSGGIALLSLFVGALALAFSACLSAGGGAYDSCVVVMPDGGISGDVVCDIGWSCNDDGAHYSLACSYQNGNYSCTCYDEGAAFKNFTVNPFTCDSSGALPAATSACGWPITLAQ